jgi:epoxyqueuosine reductase
MTVAINDLGQSLCTEARAAGFDDVGVCSIDVDQPYRSELAAAFDDGRLDPFPWMTRTRDQRLDPRVRMPKVKSVVVVVEGYFVGHHADHAPPDEEGPHAKIARYAWGQDYHHVMRRKLRRLRKWLLQRVPTATVAPFNDVDAVTERAWAVACGLGFIGKSGMFISRSLGTYTFLGGLLTDIDLVQGAPAPIRIADGCGQCTRCIDACPPGAIVAPHVVDARRCLTTWSVESPTDPAGDAFAGSGWGVGCDVCQEVCPWNKFATPTSEPRYAARHTHLSPLQAPQDVAGTPLARPGRDNLVHLARRALQPPAAGLRSPASKT